MGDDPAAKARALVDRLFRLLHDCRDLERALEPGHDRPWETPAEEADRLVYYTLLAVIEAGLVRTMEDAVDVLRRANQPLGPMGKEWLKEQEREFRRGSSDAAPESGEGPSDA